MKRLDFASLSQNSLDVVVIGGGITGTAVAHQAGLLGRSVALFEMNDFGGATSCATSKLIHGGLRYLKNLELGLVRESLRERRILGDIAPNLVEPLRFLIPNYRSRLNNWSLRLGLTLYDALAFDRARVVEPKNRLAGHATCSVAEMIEQAPMLDSHGLRPGLSYFDYANINPDRMTLAFLKTAAGHGAHLANYAQVSGLLRRENAIQGVQVTDRLTGQTHSIRSTWVINCAGPWVDSVLKLARPETQIKHTRSEGVHILTSKIQVREAIGLQTRQGDHLLFLPWRGLTIIGPTDKLYEGDPARYAPTAASIDEIIDKINSHIPAARMGGSFSRRDVLYHYGGLRPLVGIDPSGDSYSASRRYEVVDHGRQHGLTGLISVEGGKYTTSRGLAEHVLKQMSSQSNWPGSDQDSSRYVLHPCRIGPFADFLAKLQSQYSNHYSADTILYYAKNYGAEANSVLDQGTKSDDGKNRLTADGEILAEVDYVLEHEMVYNLEDLLFRRTGIGWMGQPSADVMQQITSKLSAKLNWSHAQRQSAIEALNRRHYTVP